MSKIYLIGNASNFLDDSVVSQFMKEGNDLIREGHEVVNLMYEFDWQHKPLNVALATRTSLLLSCTHVYVLPNWQLDPLAKAELAIAETAGIKCSIALGAIQPHQLVFFNHQ